MIVKLGSNGRITIPARMLEALGVEAGDAVLLQLEDGQIRIVPYHSAIRLAQEAVRRYVPEGVSLVDALLKDRREEGQRE